MRETRALSFLAAALIAVGGAACGRARRAPAAAAAVEPARVACYRASWGARSKATRTADPRGAQLTHIISACARIDERGHVALGEPCLDIGVCDSAASPRAVSPSSGGNFAELRRLKGQFLRLRLLLAVGGWTGSGRFSDAALTAESRREI